MCCKSFTVALKTEKHIFEIGESSTKAILAVVKYPQTRHFLADRGGGKGKLIRHIKKKKSNTNLIHCYK